MESKLTTMPFIIRQESLKRLLTENCVITHFTLHRYIYDLILAESLNFTEMFKDSLQDIKVALFLVEPTHKLSQAQKELYHLQRKFFKFKKVEEIQQDPNLKTDEDVLKAYNLLKRSRDPRETFNSVRRLPWKFKYNVDNSFMFKLVSSNFLVIYSFFKTTVVALLLTIVYFLYTIFFFKIQFLKQLSVWFVIGMLYF